MKLGRLYCIHYSIQVYNFKPVLYVRICITVTCSHSEKVVKTATEYFISAFFFLLNTMDDLQFDFLRAIKSPDTWWPMKWIIWYLFAMLTMIYMIACNIFRCVYPEEKWWIYYFKFQVWWKSLRVYILEHFSLKHLYYEIKCNEWISIRFFDS